MTPASLKRGKGEKTTWNAAATYGLIWHTVFFFFFFWKMLSLRGEWLCIIIISTWKKMWEKRQMFSRRDHAHCSPTTDACPTKTRNMFFFNSCSGPTPVSEIDVSFLFFKFPYAAWVISSSSTDINLWHLVGARRRRVLRFRCNRSLVLSAWFLFLY